MLSFGTSWNPIRFTFCWCYAIQQRSRSSAICALSNKEPQELRRDPITRWTSQPSWWKLFGSLKALQGMELDLYNNWLVVYPSEEWWSSSVGMVKFPTEWKVIKFHGSKQPTRSDKSSWTNLWLRNPPNVAFLFYHPISSIGTRWCPNSYREICVLMGDQFLSPTCYS